MSYIKTVTKQMHDLVKQYKGNLEDPVLYAEFTVLADRYNNYLEKNLFSLKKADLKKHIIWFSKK